MPLIGAGVKSITKAGLEALTRSAAKSVALDPNQVDMIVEFIRNMRTRKDGSVDIEALPSHLYDLIIGRVGSPLYQRAEILRDATSRTGVVRPLDKGQREVNGGSGLINAREADILARGWVGPGHRMQKIPNKPDAYMSANNLRMVRPPTSKKSKHAITGVQMNVLHRDIPKGVWEYNWHVNVK